MNHVNINGPRTTTYYEEHKRNFYKRKGGIIPEEEVFDCCCQNIEFENVNHDKEDYFVEQNKLEDRNEPHKYNINIVIVEDLMMVREMIKNFLPDFLGDDFILSFEEFDNLQGVLEYYNRGITDLIYNNEVLLLDNTFYSYGGLDSEAGPRLYNFLTDADKVDNDRNFAGKDVAENIAIISGLPKRILEYKYTLTPEENFISGKDEDTDVFLEQLGNWIKDKYTKSFLGMSIF